MAAGATYAAGNRSVDNTLRRHRAIWIERIEKQAEVDERSAGGLRRAVLREVSGRCESISRVDGREITSSGIIAAANALIRMHSTFLAASHLIRLGFAFESEAVIRLGFEQVAGNNAVRHLTVPEEVAKISGTGNMTKLQSLFRVAWVIYNRLINLYHLRS